MAGTKILDPHEAVIAVGKQNTALHEEVAQLQMELDHFRKALQQIMYMPLDDIAANPNTPRIVATIALSNGTVTEVPEPPPSYKRIIVS